MTTTILRAVQFAAQAHDGQRRKHSDGDFITHPIAVARSVAALADRSGGDDGAVIAALLHDTVEDTAVTLGQIEVAFGPDVAGLVEALTRRDGETYRAYIDRVIESGPRVRAVKRADAAHNLSTLPEGHSLRRRYESTIALIDEADGRVR